MTRTFTPEQKARRKETQRAWAAANPDKIRAAQRRHIDKVGTRSWEKRNPERVREAKRLAALRHYRRNREACNARAVESAHRRRAAGGPGVSKLAWREILAAHNGLCAYCGTAPGKTMDHIVPLSRGGVHAPHNVVPACKRCNCSKHNKLLSEWIRRPYLEAAA